MSSINTILANQEISRERIAEYMQSSAEFFNSQSGKLDGKDGFECPKCKNRGGSIVIRFIKNGANYEPYEFFKECECMTQRYLQTKIKKSGLDEYRNKNFDNFNTLNNETLINLKSKALENTDDSNAWFFVGGKSGTGKSHITAAIANSLLNKGQQVMYSSWINDFKEINFTKDSKERSLKFKELSSVDNLLLDDLFKTKDGESPTKTDIQNVMRVLDARMNKKKKTIISSEWTMKELLSVDEAIGGRIAEYCKGFVFTIDKNKVDNYRLRNYK